MDSYDYASWLKTVRTRIGGKDVKTKRGETLQGFDILPRNIAVLNEFDKEMSVSLSTYTRALNLSTLGLLADHIRKPFKQMNKSDIVEFAARFKEMNKGQPHKLERARMIIRQFFKWHVGGGDEFPPCVKWWKREKMLAKRKLPKDMLTKEEVLLMVKAAGNARDKALIITLFESGFRAGEIAGCRIKDLAFESRGNVPYAVLTVPMESQTGVAKTGEYQAILFDSEPYLKEMLNSHPLKEAPEAPLFYSTSNQNFGQPFGRGSVWRLIKLYGERAGIKRRIHPHLMRHSISTEWAREGFSLQEINIRSGRKAGSRVGDIYIHLAGGDVRKKIFEQKGLLKKEPDEEDPLRPKPCWRCGRVNPSDFMFCGTCGASLKPEIKKIVQERTKSALEENGIVTELIRDPEIARAIAKKLAKNPELLQKILGMAGK